MLRGLYKMGFVDEIASKIDPNQLIIKDEKVFEKFRKMIQIEFDKKL